MARTQIMVGGINLKWIVLAIACSFFWWALYQDTKGSLPWPYFVLTCLLGTAFGLFLIVKVVDPTMRYLDNKIDRLFKVKR